jgi:2-polyprenyl-3-methyl-5-hydroxy-6-metoxy-1,4-benzoquinol methylase
MSKIVKCYSCDSTSYEALYIKGKYKINKCLVCGFVYTSPVPSNRILNKYYRRFDNNLQNKEEIIINDSFRVLDVIYKYKRYNKTLLDIGSGNGIFLENSKLYGFEPFGLDISTKFISYYNNVLKIPLINADIRSYISKRRYDILSLNQVIEHFSDPVNVIRNCYDLLNTNGLISIATPNIQSFTAKIRQEDFDYLIPPEHLSYFSINSLKSILIRNKFKIIKIKTWTYSFDIAGNIKCLLQKNRSTKVQKHEYLKLNITRKLIKQIKYILFDKILCVILSQILNIFSKNGTMVQILAQKI